MEIPSHGNGDAINVNGGFSLLGWLPGWPMTPKCERPVKKVMLMAKLSRFLVAWVTTGGKVMFQASVGGTNCAINGTRATRSEVAIVERIQLGD